MSTIWRIGKWWVEAVSVPICIAVVAWHYITMFYRRFTTLVAKNGIVLGVFELSKVWRLVKV